MYRVFLHCYQMKLYYAAAMLCPGQTEGDIGYDARDFYDAEYDSTSGQFSDVSTLLVYATS